MKTLMFTAANACCEALAAHSVLTLRRCLP